MNPRRDAIQETLRAWREQARTEANTIREAAAEAARAITVPQESAAIARRDAAQRELSRWVADAHWLRLYAEDLYSDLSQLWNDVEAGR